MFASIVIGILLQIQNPSMNIYVSREWGYSHKDKKSK